MAKQADVELRIRSRDLSKRSVAEVTEELNALNAKLREQKDAATLASRSVKELKQQQKLLGDASANLSARRGDIEALQKQQVEIAQTTAALNKYRRELAELRTIQRSGNYLGDIDKALKTVGQSVTATSRLLDEQQGAFDRAADRARKYGIDVEDLSGSLRKVESLQSSVVNSLDDANTAFERREGALKELAAAEQEQVARQQEIIAEVKRRAAAEVEASKRALAAAKDAAEEQARIERRRAEATAAFTRQRDAQLTSAGAARELEINQRLNAVLERKAALQLAANQVANRDAALQQIEAQRRATERLTEIQQNAERVARRLEARREGMGRALVRNRTATDRAADAQRRYNAEQRTALSFNQRLRGQVLSIAAAYFGVFEAINLVRNAINTDIQRQGTVMRLQVAAEGDTRQAGKDFEYIREQADRLGQRLDPLAAQYSKFAIAAQGAGKSLETTQQVFEDFAEVGTVLQLSQMEMDGIFKALEQSFSKGIIQAEELRGQLGDRLPGAFTKLAQAIGLSNAELTKLMENGELTADALPLLAEFMADEVAAQLPEAVSNTRAELARLRTAFDDFLVHLSRGGLGEAVRELAIELRAFFTSKEGLEFAASLANGFRILVNALRTVVALLGGPNGVLNALQVLAGIKIASWAGQWAQGLGNLAVQLAATTRGANAAGAAARTMGARFMAALGPIGIALALITEAFFVYKLRSDAAAEATKRQAERLRELNTAQGQALQRVIDLTEETQKLAAARKEDALKTREQAKETLALARTELARIRAQDVPALARDAKAQRINQQLRAIQDAEEAIREAEDAIGDYNTTAAAAAVAKDRLRRESWEAEAAALREFAAIEKELSSETNREKFLNDEDYYDRLNDRARAAYALLGEASREYVKQSTLDAQNALQQTIGRLRAQRAGLDLSSLAKQEDAAAKRAYEKRQKLAEKAADELKRIDQEVLEAAADTVDGRLALLDFELDMREAKLRELQEALRKAAAETSGVEAAFLSARAAEVGTAAARFGEGGDIRAARVQDETEQGMHDEFQRREEELNELIEARAAKIEYINALREAGQLTQLEAEQRARDVMLAGQDAVAAKALALRDFLLANQGLLSGMMNVEAVLAHLDQLAIKVNTGTTASQKFLYTWREEIASGVANTFGVFAAGIADAVKGVGSWSDAFKAAGDAFLNFAADFLVNIGKMIMQAIILKAIQNAISGGSGGFWNAARGAIGVAHTGAIVGAPIATSKTVSPLAFVGAPRYHSGGFPGLRSDEVPIIAQKGEEILSRTNPRNALNGGGTPAAPSLKIINAIDSASVVSEAMNRRDGQQPIINMMRARKAEIKQILGVG